MSIERHPNINAIAFTAAMIVAFKQYVRGEAKDNPESFALACKMMGEFAADLSIAIDTQIAFKDLDKNGR